MEWSREAIKMAEKADIYESEGVIKIKPKAYITMLKHVLQYGNEGLGSQSVEVMGVCMGKEKGDDIIVYEVVPISHGNNIEVGFSPADYAAFAQVDEEYSKKKEGLYACGWYHSHPNMKAFLSKVDIKNHLFYQKEQTPKGFAIVFDHEYLLDEDSEAPFGFKAFRLNDFTKGMSSDFHESKFEILPPDDLSYYREVKQIIEATQSKKSIIDEIATLDADDSVWTMDEDQKEEGEAEEDQGPVEKVEEEGEADEMVDAAEQGLEAFNQEFTKEFLKHFDQFKDDTTKATQKGATVMVDVLATMKEIVDKGIARVRTYIEELLNVEVEKVNEDLDETFKKMDNDQREFNKRFYEFTDKVSGDISSVIKGLLSEKLSGVIDSINKAANKSESIGKQSETFKQALQEQQTIVEQLKDEMDKDTSQLGELIDKIKSEVSSESSEKSKQIVSSITDLLTLTEEISKTIDDIAKKVS
ncbi:MAG: hypothetical protein GF364_00455 [Candidatus Lokiarchaeota archaeon]|nr:hypothetical protein [Candidatus Lokiarchaeota archaeon]